MTAGDGAGWRRFEGISGRVVTSIILHEVGELEPSVESERLRVGSGFEIRNDALSGAWMAQLVEHSTLDFDLGHDLMGL